jgi:hypothetical protein
LKLVNITFVVPFGGYNVNESVSFESDRAEALIAKKVAVPYVEPEAVESKKKTTKKKVDESCPAEESQPENLF